MLGKLLVVGLALGFTGTILVAESASSLSAADIANKNVAARGGLKAWHAVQTISESGKMGAGGNDRAPVAAAADVKRPGKPTAPLPASPRLKEEAQLPFRLDLERPRKMRLELDFNGQTAVQVYDGANGWKVRPYLNRMEVENYTQDELKLAALQSDLDGPLVDYAAKGTKVELEGTEKVEDRDTYRLKLTMKDGHVTHVWIDSKTFLEAKIEGAPRRLDGQEREVDIFFRDYRTVDGLQIPFVLETRVQPVATPAKGARIGSQYPPEKIVIDKVQVNPKFEASMFARPVIETTASAKPH
jgi:outer membrane lipoprotein-sorting protein